MHSGSFQGRLASGWDSRGSRLSGSGLPRLGWGCAGVACAARRPWWLGTDLGGSMDFVGFLKFSRILQDFLQRFSKETVVLGGPGRAWEGLGSPRKS